MKERYELQLGLDTTVTLTSGVQVVGRYVAASDTHLVLADTPALDGEQLVQFIRLEHAAVVSQVLIA